MRFTTVSTLAALFLSILPFILDMATPRPVRMLVLFDAFIIFVAMLVVIFGRFKSSAFWYGKWMVKGGNCPSFVEECQPLNNVGCGFEKLNAPNTPNIRAVDPNTSNILGTGELIFGVLLVFGPVLLIIALLFAILLIVYCIYSYCESAVLNGLDPPQRWKRTNKAILKLWSILDIILILILFPVSPPLHYRQQTHPKVQLVIDSFGTIETVAHRNSTEYTGDEVKSWSDCFEVRAPADAAGFWEVYWDERNRLAQDYLRIL
jgi:hypothetical protein